MATMDRRGGRRKGMPPVNSRRPRATSTAAENRLRASDEPSRRPQARGDAEGGEQEPAAGEEFRHLLVAVLRRHFGAEPLVDPLELRGVLDGERLAARDLRHL